MLPLLHCATTGAPSGIGHSYPSADASAILDAAADIAAGEDTGLTPAQLRACDANLDGKINSIDASLVLEFYSLVQEGIFEGDVEGWTEFLNYKQEKGKGVV